jgi:hypothetical protein
VGAQIRPLAKQITGIETGKGALWQRIQAAIARIPSIAVFVAKASMRCAS